MAYIPPKFEPVIPDSVGADTVEETPVLIVGAGPIGLAAALDLGLRGYRVVVVDKDTQLSDGSRAICYAKRPLEIMDRLGFGEAMLDKGVSWNVGRVFFKESTKPVYSFDLLPIKDQKFPGMINIQQYYNEEYNIAELEKLDNVDLRWGNQVVDIQTRRDGALASVETPQGGYVISADWVIACDGAHSPVRKMLNVDFEGQTFKDNFLIADVKFTKEHPSERHFWFDPPFNPGRSVLLHKQPDNIWRIDFQVGWDIDRDEITKPENVRPMIESMLGEDLEFEFEWISLYTFNCRQITQMVVGPVIFAGDSAHLVSPFGARGANTGFQDVDNLGWKLDLILSGKGNKNLLASYHQERSLAARINILNSTRSTDFITPKSRVSGLFRDAVLELAKEHEFARGFVNSGRLSVPVPYPESDLNTPDSDNWAGGLAPGFNAVDAPIEVEGRAEWFLNQLGWTFKAVVFVGEEGLPAETRKSLTTLKGRNVPIEVLLVGCHPDKDFTVLRDVDGLLTQRMDAEPGTTYLFRPDQYVAGRWRKANAGVIAGACDKCAGIEGDNDV